MDIPFFSFFPFFTPLSSLFLPVLASFFLSFFVFSLSRVRLGGGETNGDSKNAGTKGGQQRNTRDSFELTVGMRLARFASLVN